uniref:Uncharacterized protein n=1 Tax=Pseudictyota dubia TaxID=2749911 RepID=A0A7R9VWX4_9STRA|mmetsp:Transcript_25317/g.47081  ORF Transcript_25317/g.47081 Transcript_25317/m.47081 type:complete len:126 (+) Transcript_25317:53-430(+)
MRHGEMEKACKKEHFVPHTNRICVWKIRFKPKRNIKKTIGLHRRAQSLTMAHQVIHSINAMNESEDTFLQLCIWEQGKDILSNYANHNICKTGRERQQEANLTQPANTNYYHGEESAWYQITETL